jgi:hypothetical protein
MKKQQPMEAKSLIREEAPTSPPPVPDADTTSIASSVEDGILFGSMRGLVLHGGGEELLDPLEIHEPSDPFLDRDPLA